MPPRRGTTALEFALCLPVWVAIVLAIIDFAWMFYNQTALDSASNHGCRAGSLIDPGDNDEHIIAVQQRASTVMEAELQHTGFGDCWNCSVSASTVGVVPVRSLVCETSRQVRPLVGLFFDSRVLASTQVARLEWQRGAAP